MFFPYLDVRAISQIGRLPSPHRSSGPHVQNLREGRSQSHARIKIYPPLSMGFRSAGGVEQIVSAV